MSDKGPRTAAGRALLADELEHMIGTYTDRFHPDISILAQSAIALRTADEVIDFLSANHEAEAAALDVEALERAMHKVLPHLHGPHEKVPNPLYVEWAVAIAAEYARLATRSQEEKA